ncbi:MAG: TonB family protein [Vicinamibacteraceae bacterium]
MTFPPPPPPPLPPVPPPPMTPGPMTPGPGQLPGAIPAAKKPSSMVPLLIMAAIGMVALIAGVAVAIMLVMMGRAATPPSGPGADTPPVTDSMTPGSPAAEPPLAAPPVEPPLAESSAPASPAPETPAVEAEHAAEPASPSREPRATPRERSPRPAAEAATERTRRAEADAENEPVERAVRVGGAIARPTKVRNVQPVYPRIAQSARVQGVVIIEATIDTKGRVSDMRVLRSIPLLDQAAIDAVRQWEYEPTLLNGVAVPVIMTVTVNFTLQP